MRVVIQSVRDARVKVVDEIDGEIGLRVLVFLAIGQDDNEQSLDWMVKKVSQLRIFEDADGKMNFSAQEVGAKFLIISQFTLLGNCVKGRRPSFDKAADPKKAEDFYNRFVEKLRQKNFKVATGIFRANMQVALVNDGPVTFVIDG